MNKQFVSYKIALNLKKLGFDEECLLTLQYMNDRNATTKIPYEPSMWIVGHKKVECNITKEQLQKDFNNALFVDIKFPLWQQATDWVREKRGVHIEIHRNASGYYWSMCKSDSGTDLGWSYISGPNDGGVWDSFEEALENALQVQLSYDLSKDLKVIKHWGNYVDFALKSLKLLEDKL